MQYSSSSSASGFTRRTMQMSLSSSPYSPQTPPPPSPDPSYCNNPTPTHRRPHLKHHSAPNPVAFSQDQADAGAAAVAREEAVEDSPRPPASPQAPRSRLQARPYAWGTSAAVEAEDQLSAEVFRADVRPPGVSVRPLSGQDGYGDHREVSQHRPEGPLSLQESAEVSSFSPWNPLHPNPVRRQGTPGGDFLIASEKEKPFGEDLQKRGPLTRKRILNPASEASAERGSVQTGEAGGDAEKTSPSWRSIQADRQRQVQEFCTAKRYLAYQALTENVILIPHRSFMYCPVEKAASTFMRRFVYTLSQTSTSDTLKSPFEIPIQTALNFSFQTPRTLRLKRIKYDLRKSSFQLMVTREPYSRIFSAFVDKLITPNDYYWKTWGTSIAKKRPSPRMLSLKCGHDATFPEFVQLVIEHLHRIDPHLKPMSRLCSPCKANYTFIGRLETLRSDFDHLRSALKVTIANFSVDELRTKVPYDAIQDSARSAFQFYPNFQHCLSKHNMCRRLWLKLQMRGILDVRLPFPLTREEAEEVSYEAFFKLLLQGWRDSTDVKRLRIQKYQAMKKAFSNIPAEDLEELSEIYDSDFQMFGYEKYPPFLPKKKVSTESDGLKLFFKWH